MSFEERAMFKHKFPLMESVRVSLVAEHNQTFVAVKTATQLEKARYVIFALQTGRKSIMSRDVSVFDNCNLTNIKLYLNSEFYPMT